MESRTDQQQEHQPNLSQIMQHMGVYTNTSEIHPFDMVGSNLFYCSVEDNIYLCSGH